MSPILPISQPIISDWAQFSTSGFGETSATTPLAAMLLDTEKDAEITEPPPSQARNGEGHTRGSTEQTL